MTAVAWSSEFVEACGHRKAPGVERRPGNALNIEIGTPVPRCTAKPPDNWPEGMALRWIMSGGDVLVFGPCTSRCPRCV